MRVAYILNSPNAANYKVGEMILPQLENDAHGVEVVGIFFFDDNTMLLQKGNPKGRDGTPLTCHGCNSTDHLVKNCPLKGHGKGNDRSRGTGSINYGREKH